MDDIMSVVQLAKDAWAFFASAAWPYKVVMAVGILRIVAHYTPWKWDDKVFSYVDKVFSATKDVVVSLKELLKSSVPGTKK